MARRRARGEERDRLTKLSRERCDGCTLAALVLTLICFVVTLLGATGRLGPFRGSKGGVSSSAALEGTNGTSAGGVPAMAPEATDGAPSSAFDAFALNITAALEAMSLDQTAEPSGSEGMASRPPSLRPSHPHAPTPGPNMKEEATSTPAEQMVAQSAELKDPSDSQPEIEALADGPSAAEPSSANSTTSAQSPANPPSVGPLPNATSSSNNCRPVDLRIELGPGVPVVGTGYTLAREGDFDQATLDDALLAPVDVFFLGWGDPTTSQISYLRGGPSNGSDPNNLSGGAGFHFTRSLCLEGGRYKLAMQQDFGARECCAGDGRWGFEATRNGTVLAEWRGGGSDDDAASAVLFDIPR